MSALPSKADIGRLTRNIRLWPLADFTPQILMSALPPKADISLLIENVR
jgi:hypothetical protein